MKVPHKMITNKMNRRFSTALVGIALGLTILCSCRGPAGRTAGMKLHNNGEQAYVISDEPISQEASSDQVPARIGSAKSSKAPAAGVNPAADAEITQTAYEEGPTAPIPRIDCPEMGQSVPLPYDAYPPWTPDGIKQPWPADEYLRDGGDRRMPTGVTRDWHVKGLEMEDAVAHYDTLAGKRIVEPSNEVFIYAPRFGAVRQVVGVASNEGKVASHGVTEDIALDKPTHTQLFGSATANIQPGNQISARPPHALLMKQGDGAISTVVGPRSFQDAFKTYENITVLRTGQFVGSEALRLAKSAQAAVSWNETQAVQAILNLQGPMTAVQDEKVESVYNVKFEGKPALRLIKVASTAFANPGEEVWFTLRFDNMGNETIGNVTILDSLSTRLEYVEGSAQCSREGNFSTQANEGDSVVLRFELKDPLEASQGGVIRFRCIVR